MRFYILICQKIFFLADKYVSVISWRVNKQKKHYLPDMLTVFNHKEVGIEVVSNEETNHVGVTNKDFVEMPMCDMVPPEAYQNIHSNMCRAITMRTVSAANHELDVNGKHHYYENRIFPLDEEYVFDYVS